MIVVIGGQKGGCGKTTICTNLTALRASEGYKTLLVDADDQRSSADWSEHRENQNITTPWTTVQLLGPAVRTQILKLKDDYQNIFVDSGGRDTVSQRSALTVADLFLVPFAPRSFDIWTLGKVNALVAEIRTVNPKLKAYALINRADSSGADNSTASEILKESEELEYLDVVIVQRKAFANAASEGLAVFELKTQDKKAVTEIRSLYDAIFASK